ncbi:hypothetical protein EW026_g64 [Hermanssonia centrifuga]|uniref:Uncharacterized protein n=1 Tax=Hermanssonia centrifuga TaxID=98765 RepID=A0A4S4KWX6_9APHY|nr:hypothetical protein EW026_g64 [Hermanssonia centrifuga]
MPTEPPPTYSQDQTNSDLPPSPNLEPQILILPSENGVNFQKGYLGADGERAAIEGELQVKGAGTGRWAHVMMSLRTIEHTHNSEVELASSEVVLYSALSSQSEGGPSPSIYPFSIPLPPDTPQCVHTSQSGLEHTLTATLQSADTDAPKLSSTIIVHTRRYMSHPHTLHTEPETKIMEDPTRVEVQIPRTAFTAGEALPLYITVPSPRRELILDEGLRLRNIRAELIRIVKVNGSTDESGLQSTINSTKTGAVEASTSSSSHSLDMRSILGVPGGGEVIAVSGASCRLHPTRPLQIRLVLRPPHEQASPISHSGHDHLPATELGQAEPTTSCASISQTTLLHSISFAVCVHITFMHMHSHTERISTISIPVTMLPPSAPLPELEESMDTAYHKKHDRPPARTVRQDDVDVPDYSESEAGPSYAPPPFEEREAPPPFFLAEPEASTSRLPTFLESEAEIYVQADEDPTSVPPPQQLFFQGEGIDFGFTPLEQFDGYPDHDGSLTPPPTMEMATRDPNVTNLATLDDNAALDALELALENHPDAAHDDALPPPPPALDDPSDPPPSIDSDFRCPGARQISTPPQHHAAPAFSPHTASTDAVVVAAQVASHGHAPPPYAGVPDHNSDEDHEHVARPPPYVDLVPAAVLDTP